MFEASNGKIIYVFFCVITSSSIQVIMFLVISSVLLYNFLNIDFVKAEYAVSKSEATGGKIGLFFKPGIVIDDIQRRSVSQADYVHTFNLPMQQKK